MNDDNPTVEYNNGEYKEWSVNDRRSYHRINGPARKWSDGSEEWFINNKLHRLDGPAIIYVKNHGLEITYECHWYIYNKRIDEQEIKTYLNTNYLFDKETQIEFLLRFG